MRSLGLGFSLATLLSFVTFAQTAPSNEPANASISGLVTLDGKPARGVTVLALPDDNLQQPRASALAKTNAEGRYRLLGLTARRYKIFAAAREYVSTNAFGGYLPGQSVTLGAGEQYEASDLTLERGGVITGRVTDAQGQPLIEEKIHVYRFNERGQKTDYVRPYASEVRTDDRGVYRVYGLPAGRYAVAAGYGENDSAQRYNTGSRRAYQLTYHPDKTDAAQATVLDVKPGSESTDVNIKLTASSRGLTIAVRVVDAKTGQPVPNLNLGYARAPLPAAIVPVGYAAAPTDQQGLTRFQGVLPGRYAAYLSLVRESMMFYCEPDPFEVTEDGPPQVELRVRRAAQVSGMVIFEDAANPTLVAQLKGLGLQLARDNYRPPQIPYPPGVQLDQDLSFRFEGIPAGRYRLMVHGNYQSKGFVVARVEQQDGVLRDVIEVKSGEQLSGLRVKLAYGQATLRGNVQVLGGTLPANASIYISARNLDNPNTTNRNQTATRGDFVFENLVGGQYELLVMVVLPQSPAPAPGSVPRPVRQRVTVSSVGETQITFTLDLSAQGRRQ